MDVNGFISDPVEFRKLEGNGIDFRKTFNLRGCGTDEMLQLYLRKANLSDHVDRLPSAQRRAYIYDIVRSKRGPGYWVPPSMHVSKDIFANPPPAVRPPPPARPSPNLDRQTYAKQTTTMSNSSSSNSIHSYNSSSGSSTTAVLVSKKGSKYEISGPMNFQHVSGDVTRDRTRNAFDLGAGAPDNVLKKYMMERGITEQDVAHIRRDELIKKIVHSNFTWMPPKREAQVAKQPTLSYATISTNNSITPPSSPPPTLKQEKPPLSLFANYSSLTSRFVDISDMPIPAEDKNAPQEVGNVVAVHVHQPQAVIKPKIPPPPSAVMATNSRPVIAEAQQVHPNEIYATISPQRKAGTLRAAPPAPPKPSVVPPKSTVAPTKPTVAPPKPTVMPSKPPPPPAPPALTTHKPTPPVAVSKSKGNTAINTAQSQASGAAATPPPPPPPPPPTSVAGALAPPPPPPPPPVVAAGTVPPPPPPPAVHGTVATKKSEPSKSAITDGDDRGALLASIRQGVTLKKVDQKAATISGVKPRAEKKPPPTDFLSELKLGLTLRRVKNPADNPYSEENADESHA